MDLSDFGFLGIAVSAFVLGAGHSLEPGHGKTVLAAYLVGSRGRNIDAVLLGLATTFAHSITIIMLGLLATIASRSYSAQQVHGTLSVVASLVIVGLGLWMVWTRWPDVHGHSDGHRHFHLFGGHHHHDRNEHGHDHSHARRDPSGLPSVSGLILLGVSGGMVPCPAALAILLAAAAAGDLGKGLLLVIVFSLGLAASLVTLGLLVINGVRATRRLVDTEQYAPKIAFASAIIVTAIGAVALWSSVQFG
jgi:nickel/cobalt transporter (NicO) family protein